MDTRVLGSDRFYGGAPMGLEGWIGLIKPDDLRIRARTVLVVLIGWFPLVVLAGLQDVLYGGNSLSRLLLDFGAIARYVVAAPLLVIAECVCFPIFEKIILHFRDSGLIASRDKERYEAIVHSSSGLLTSKVAEVFCFVIAYAITLYWTVVVPPNALVSWSYVSGSAGASLSLAGMWHV